MARLAEKPLTMMPGSLRNPVIGQAEMSSVDSRTWDRGSHSLVPLGMLEIGG